MGCDGYLDPWHDFEYHYLCTSLSLDEGLVPDVGQL